MASGENADVVKPKETADYAARMRRLEQDFCKYENMSSAQGRNTERVVKYADMFVAMGTESVKVGSR